ncbi:hypothetical protein PFAG_05923 [Plasmodium falciparum Santa Lucia]|uniref:Erythrocyte membrane protein 1, PfEMP1 n=1 Tax=Plasmodium falciparum Santa Lucia TaxID=478859 RepID=W7FL61_PLAFA|nr:hypothetical protein PFAG_05923 [Plasmodium falciparum Santa Lucia]
MDKLIDYEKDEAESCLEIHEDDEKWADEYDSDEDDHEAPPIMRSNPCAKPSGSYPSLVNQIAHQIHELAKLQLSIRGGGRKTLRADASLGTYKKNGKPSNLKENICKINLQHSNDSRGTTKDGPCQGKGNGFTIGTPWKDDKFVRTTHKDVYMPPRRQHMCTSNLENLDVDYVTKKDNVNDTFLGNVLLAANYEAKKIKEKYRGPNGQNNHKGKCRALRYSFADLGDIIRGTDLWDHTDQKNKLQVNLKDVFEKIKKHHPAIQGNKKYKDDENNKPPYKLLREDWWEANRYQVWRAMKCAMKNGNIDKCNGIPIEDYIPQRLRWMTEWAEWFCKMQSQQYDKLEEECGICMNGTCKDVLGKGCVDCKKQCQEYEKNIKEWADQWTIMDMKYRTLYLQAQITARNPGDTSFDNPNDQYVIKFLQKLQEATGDTTRATTSTTITPYSTAAGYIHQEIGYGGCQVQTQFCEKENGDTSSTATNNGKYAFKHPPTDYKDKCECKENEAQPKKVETPKHNVEVCSIVEQALKTSLTDACTLKYGSKSHVGWKCVTPSGEKSGGSEPTGTESERLTRQRREAGVPTTTSSGPTSGKSGDTTGGSICIPPRRRRLYVGKLEQWATNTVETQARGSEAQASESSPASTSATSSRAQSHPLLTAFVESAAVETFFLWHRYKEQWKAQKKAEQQRQQENGGLATLDGGSVDGDSNDPEKQLKSGNIPPDFLRLMFYTLGDYRDLCVGNTDIVVEALSSSEKEKMKEIQDKIKEHINNGSSSPPPVKTPSQPGDKLKSWWELHGPEIWDGMICALTYKDNSDTEAKKSDGTTNITQDQSLKTALLDKEGKKPKPKTDGTNGKDYTYGGVKLDDTSDTQAKTNTPKTTLKNFVERPPYFRYLEEWGEEFCRQRTRMLKNVKHNCRNSERNGHQYCSGDGHDCTENGELKHKDILADLYCPDCYVQCRKYKKWIDKKFEEFYKQEKKYKGEHDKLTKDKSGGGDNNCCKEIEHHSSAADFLKELKHCKPGDDDKDKNDEINFKQPLETFRHSKYCEMCPSYEVKCNGSNRRGKNPCTEVNGNGNTWESVFNANGGNSTTIDVKMIDRRGPFIDKNSEKSFKDSYLFKSVRNQQWECKVINNDTDVCKLTNFDETIDLNQYTTFKVLLIYWLEDFLYGYYLLKTKKLIEECTKRGKNTCDKEPKNDCACVKEWIEKKKEEWRKINSTYLKKYKPVDDGSNDLNSFLETLLPQIALTNGKEKISDLDAFLMSYGCNGTHSSQKDVVLCLIDNLDTKIKKCPSSTSGSEQCTTPPSNLDDDDTPEDNESPEFCLEIPKPELPKKKEPCEIVDGILNGKSAADDIEGCKKKDDGTNSYPSWKCGIESGLVMENGICMPPRRQKLCLYYLKELNGETENDLREAFIKTAAAETFVSWKYYKSKNNNGENTLDEQLKKGYIPEEFLRSMFYTYGDYRDICLGTDISVKQGDVLTANQKIEKILPKNGTPPVPPQTSVTTPQTWWEANAQHIWEGMVCSLTYVGGNKETLTGHQSKYQYNKVTFSGDKTTTLEEFAQTPQFLRWMTEWGEDFCKKRKEQLENLKDKCPDYTCSVDSTKQQCEKACKVYQDWLKTWKDQYKKQSKKFTKDKEKTEYNGDPDVKKSTHAYEYLSKKLKSICQNGTTTEKCDYNCMENASRQPQTSACSQEQQQQGNTSSTQNHFPEAFDCPPKEIGDKCNCPKLPEPKYCVDKTAYDIRKEREKNVANIYSKLKKDVKDFNSQCNKVNKNNVTVKDSCNFEETYKKSLDNINETCKGKGVDRLKIGQKWNSKYITKIGKDIFIPPRREYICLHDLNTLMASTIHDRNDLLKKIQDIAKIEGDDIIKKLLPQYPCNEDVICKAMKYSFADLGDIIRGRDMLLGINSANAYETTLKVIFEKIKTKWENENYTKNKGKYPDLPSFRSAWWDANRKEIWKAMTCNAPDEAKIYITKEGGYISPLTWTKNKCGHNDDPPDYDYIPQPLRWISEWGESYCLAQKDFLESMKNCENCKKKNKNADCEQTKYGSCVDCKKKCEKYKKFVENWKKQFEIQDKAYKEIYKKATSNGRYFNGIDENTKNFVKELDKNCKTDDFTTADKYLEGGSVCRRFKFGNTQSNHPNYAFHNTPLSYVDHCECAKKYDPLDECPVDKDVCEKYGRYSCRNIHYNKNPIEWTNHFVKKSIRNYEAVMVPPRRRQLCLISNRTFIGRVNDEKRFKEYLLRDASSEAKRLSQYYNSDNEKALQAIKYSFADIGNIVKGDDMLDDLEVVQKKLNEIFKQNKNGNVSDNRKKWWQNNKEQIWNVMMCQYKGKDKTPTSCPKHDDIDKVDQFLRWMTEWSEHFCTRQKELEKQAQKQCNKATCDKDTGNIDSKCIKACKHYSNFILIKKNEYQSLKKQYNDNHKSTQAGGKEAHLYIKDKCKDDKCNCLDEKFNNDNWKNPYETLEETLKNKCTCIKTESKCPKDIYKVDDEKTKQDIVKPTTPSNKTYADEASPKKTEVLPPQPSDNTSDILEKTIPFGIALALGSIAFLFMKKKTQAPVDLFSVINIPKSDYDIPTLKSKNRYIPYRSGSYKGKTYIYMEGDSDEDKYPFMSDTTDVTSSESEYEEMDINDIYVPGSPKYKTLIEVVLEPSGNNTTASGNNTTASGKNTPSDTQNDIQNDGIPSSKITDNEWNTLKHDFISNMLQNTQNTEPNMLGFNVDNNTHPTPSHNKLDQKPFITSIHDRDLYTGEEYNYNVNMSTNTMDDPKYVSNNVYSGIDLINDTLSGNHNVDIYDELLKRKENELFGTNHVKQTSIHSVAKLTNSDPIHNQLELFHKWLDRHRDMCEQWDKNKKEELLDKLKEEWENETHSGNIHPSDSNKTSG